MLMLGGPIPAGANPCEHLGRCVNTQGSFLCQCGRGYTGPRCETDVNECLSGPCRNQATCLDRIGQFTCICMAGVWWVWPGQSLRLWPRPGKTAGHNEGPSHLGETVSGT